MLNGSVLNLCTSDGRNELDLVYCSILLQDKCTSCSILRSSTLPWQSRPVLTMVHRLPKLVSCLQHGCFQSWTNVMQDG